VRRRQVDDVCEDELRLPEQVALVGALVHESYAQPPGSSTS
jgi:transposase